MEWRRVRVPMLAVILRSLRARGDTTKVRAANRPPLRRAPPRSSGSTVAVDSRGCAQSTIRPSSISRASAPRSLATNEEAVRMAWGHPLTTGSGAEGSPCRILAMDPPPDNGRGIRFMLDDGHVRALRRRRAAARGAGRHRRRRRRSTRCAPRLRGASTSRPLKYVEGGKELIVSAARRRRSRGSSSRSASAARSANWRIGVPPQVYYVEGCG